MPLSVFLLGLTGALAVTCLATGRALFGVLDARRLARRSLENLVASAFCGTAFFFLSFGWFSYLGFPARSAAASVGVLWLALLAALAIRNRLGLLVPWKGDASYWRLALAGFAAIAIFLLPLFLGNSYLLVTDFKHYANGAEYLQGHGFGTPAVADDDFPTTVAAVDFQRLNHRMGPMFFLAFVEVLIPGSFALELVPAVMAWGLVLNVLSTYLLCRWSARLNKFCSWSCAMLVAVGANPLQFSAEYGFLCQIYGTAALGFCLAMLSRMAAPGRRTWSSAFVLATGAAFLLSAYGELAPFLLLAGLAFAVRFTIVLPGKQSLEFVAFTGLTFLFLALIANIEIVRSVRAVLTMMNVHGVGWHVPWSDAQYAGFGLGIVPCKFYAAYPSLFVLLPVGALFLWGLGRATADVRSLPLAVAVWTFLPLALYYRGWARDPWTDDIGHTWNLFKLCQWAFPLAVVLQMAGLRAVLTKPAPRRLVVGVLCLLLAVVSAPRHWKEANYICAHAQRVCRSARPLDEMRDLRRQIDELGNPPVYLIRHSTESDRASIYATILPDTAFVSGRTVALEALPRETLFLMHGSPSFEPPLKILPAGLSVIDPQGAIILGITKVDSLEMVFPDVPSALNREPTRLFLWSPKAGSAHLDLDFEPGPACPRTTGRRIRLASATGPPQEMEVDCGRTISIPLSVRAGVNVVLIQCLDQPHASASDDIVSQMFLLRLAQGRLKMD